MTDLRGQKGGSFEKGHDEAERAVERDGDLYKTQRESPLTALVIKALPRDERAYEDPFAEIVDLCRTAGATVLDTVHQNVDRISASTYLGRGKIEEIAEKASQLDVDFIVADNDLSPAQERNLEKVFKRTVLDRSQVILDIFARRASTLQARLQVELAQLKYTYPRLKRMWGHLSRYEGGIGMRGPGETQLETDKRLIQRRIRLLRRKLDAIETRRNTRVRGRDDFVIALVGYTNVGKSTLLNRLTSSDELVEDKLFATLDTRTRKWMLGKNRHVLLNDTVGFIRQLPHHLVASFHATLAETADADLLFHVVDASAAQARRQMRAVADVLGKIGCADSETWVLFNKWDRLVSGEASDDAAMIDGGSTDREVEARNLVLAAGGAPVFEVSAATGQGLDELTAAVEGELDQKNRRVSLVLPHERGDLLSFICENGHVLTREYEDDGAHLEFEMSPARLEKLRSLYPAGFPSN